MDFPSRLQEEFLNAFVLQDWPQCRLIWYYLKKYKYFFQQVPEEDGPVVILASIFFVFYIHSAYLVNFNVPKYIYFNTWGTMRYRKLFDRPKI